MTRLKVTSPMGEDDPYRGHVAYGRGRSHNDLLEATPRQVELQRQLDGLQNKATELHKAREGATDGPELSSEVQSLKEKLEEHSKYLEQSAEKLGRLESENLALRDENQALNMASNKKRHFRARIRSMPDLETPSSGAGVTHPSPVLDGDGAPREKTEAAQVYDIEDSDSELEPEQEALNGAAAARPSSNAYLEQIFAEKFDAIQSLVERLPGVAPPIRKSNRNSYAEFPLQTRSP
ncbi:hypothetical protein Bca4012_065465 [Brassica carinata]